MRILNVCMLAECLFNLRNNVFLSNAGTMNNTSNSSCFPTPEEANIISIIQITCGTVSFICCLFMLFAVLLFRKFKSTTARVILYLTIIVTFYSVVFVLHGIREREALDNKNTSLCTALGFFDQIASWMELLAITCLTFDLFVKVMFLNFHTEKYEIAYGLIIFGLPFLFNWIPFINDTYGFSGSLCWISQYVDGNCMEINHFGQILRFVLFWIPFYIIMLLVGVAYFVALIKAYRRVKQYTGTISFNEQVTKELLLSEVRQYCMYPIMFTLMMTAALISRIAEAIHPESQFFALRVIHVLAFSLQGPVIAIIFALDKETRRQLTSFKTVRAALFTLFCPCKIRKIEEYQTIVESNPNESLIPSEKQVKDVV